MISPFKDKYSAKEFTEYILDMIYTDEKIIKVKFCPIVFAAAFLDTNVVICLNNNVVNMVQPKTTDRFIHIICHEFGHYKQYLTRGKKEMRRIKKLNDMLLENEVDLYARQLHWQIKDIVREEKIWRM